MSWGNSPGARGKIRTSAAAVIAADGFESIDPANGGLLTSLAPGSATIGKVDQGAPNAGGALGWPVQALDPLGNATAGAPDAAVPPPATVQVGSVAKDTAPTAVTAGRAVRPWLSRIGAAAHFITDATSGVIASLGVTTVSATVSSMLNTLPWALYHATPVTRTEGQGGPVETDVLGSARTAEQNAQPGQDDANWLVGVCRKLIAGSTYAPTSTISLGAATAGFAKAAAGNVLACSFTNSGATGRWVQLFNKASAPTSPTEIPIACWWLPASSTLIVGEDFFVGSGLYCSLGIAWGVSSTYATYTSTSVTAAEHIVHLLTK